MYVKAASVGEKIALGAAFSAKMQSEKVMLFIEHMISNYAFSG